MDRLNMSVLARPEKSGKWERVRCLRYGQMLVLFRDRWGYQLPDDEAGRGDLWELVTNVSLAARDPEKKMRHAIEVWAPWMDADEAERYVKLVWGLELINDSEPQAS